MYEKYSTDALILDLSERGEADRSFALYTKTFGLVWARAAAVRTERSKMRGALQSCARAHVSLVMGKRGWRLAGAVAHTSSIGVPEPGLRAFARIAQLVVRLCAGEERNPYLFEALAEAQRALFTEGTDTASIEIVCVARVLYALGYLSDEALETTIFSHTAYGVSELAEVEEKRDALLSSINRAIVETQL
jgi:recombinational DNA repair protein (RecF pathway)